MQIIKIEKSAWAEGIDTVRKSYLLFGPVKRKSGHIFAKLEDGGYPDMEYTQSVLSPKAVLFPQTQKMLETSLDKEKEGHHVFTPVTQDDTPKAVLGIRPYDAKAVQLVKLNFDTEDYRDSYWCDAYEATTFVGLAVNTPSMYDFSCAAGSGPFAEEGLDVLLVDCEDHYLAKVLSSKGQDFMAKAGFNDAQDADQAGAVIAQMQAKAQEGMNSDLAWENIEKKTVMELYDAPFWDEVAFSCVNCGTCTYVCPTCWCFDIQDETKGSQVTRFRNWDTCMSPLFTLHSSGHNPRGEKIQRVRQRFMHKLKYFPEKYGEGLMCVGCGRCVEKCPANIDIREVCSLMNASKA